MDTNAPSGVQTPGKPPAPPPQAVMMRAIGSMTFPLVIKSALELGVFRALKNGPADVADLARSLEVNPAALERLMRALASTGLVAAAEPGTYAVTDLGATLTPGPTPKSIEPLAQYLLDESMILPMLKLSESVRTGKPTLEQDAQRGWYDEYPERAGLMDRAMEVYSKISLPSLLAAYPFAQFSVIVDVAGGVGQMLAGILKSNPSAKGVLFDLPGTIARADGYMKAAGLDGRCELVAGDMFESVPAGGDLYVLSKTLNNWDDEHAVDILRTIRSAMTGAARLIIVESLGSAGAPQPEEAFRDLTFLACSNGGRVRTEGELRDAIAKAGLHVTRIVQTGSPFPIIECQLATA